MRSALQWHQISGPRLKREGTYLTALPYFALERKYLNHAGHFTAIGTLRYAGERSGKFHTIRVRLEYPRNFPQRAQHVFDHDKIFTPSLDGHLFSTHEVCLTLLERGEFSVGTEQLTEEVLGATLVWFHKRLLFERTKTWPGPAERHGIYAIIDFLVEKRVVADANAISTWLLVHAGTPAGHACEPDVYAPCPCGSGKSLKFCHREELKPILDRIVRTPRGAILANVLDIKEGER